MIINLLMSACRTTEKIFDARLTGDICWRKGCV
nr:MAG TPA: hypothetical protein [Caudoviricetes sp.]